MAGVWGIDPDELPRPGLSAYEMLDRMGTDGGVRALLLMASNIVVSAPDVNRVRDRLAALDLLVVSDIFLSETAELADVVLPDRPVGRGGGHHDQPRGPGHPPPPGAAAARRHPRRPAD